ncbi:MAG: hypothetical protein ACPL3P_04075 [Anaerolineales bacterium]
MHKLNVLSWFSLILLVVFSAALFWTMIPSPPLKFKIYINWDKILSAEKLTENGNQNRLLMSGKQQVMTVTIPKIIYLGEKSEIRLEITDQPLQTTDTGDGASGFTNSLNQESSRLTLEANLDLSNAQLSPAAQIRQILPQDGHLRFRWAIYPQEQGDLSGMLWVYGIVGQKDQTSENRFVLSALPFVIKTAQVFGLIMPTFRWFMIGGMLLSFVLLLEGRLRHSHKNKY